MAGDKTTFVRPTLRNYQRECLDAIGTRYREGIRRQLTCLPTGTGKTVIFAEFPRYFRMKKQMLVLAHRAELLDQARDKIMQSNPDLCVEVDQAGRSADPGCDVVVASVPTLGRKGSKRLRRLDPEGFFLFVVDEAHHATAATYKRVLDYFGVFAPDTQKLLVGFTATPKRGDGVGLDAVFEEIVFSKSLPEMIRTGYLSPIAGYRVETDVDLSRVKTRMGDFVTAQLSDAVNIQARNDIIVDVYKSHLSGKQTLCFCVDISHTHSVAEAFNHAGIKAAAISGDMEAAPRQQILRDFHEGHIQVIANCMVLTEGYDEPTIAGIILARPTKSGLLYTQMIGRGTRLYPGKANVTVVDIVDATKDHRLTTLPSLIGLSEDFDLEGHTTDQAEDATNWVKQHRPWVPIDQATSITDLRYRCTKIDLLDLQTPSGLLRSTRFAWVGIGKSGYRLSLKEGNAITVSSTILGHWEVNIRIAGKESTIASHANWAKAVELAESHVTKRYPEQLTLVSRETRWRKDPATEKQIRVLQSRSILAPAGLTKGQASHLISMLS
ncbi:MAG: DEAD/DEAH box helicase [Desulfobacterales bacterium]